MSDSIKLSLEQKFSIRSFETQVKAMSHEQAQEFLVKLYEQMILKRQYVSRLYSSSMGIRFTS